MGTGEDAPSPAVELEHAVGYSALKGGLKYHPNEREYLFAAGASIIVCDFTDPHQQTFLRGHDGNITCLALSRTGKYIASGQYGENSDAIVWDFSAKRLLYRMSEHDHGVECLAFSDDELLLCTVGAVDDNKVLIWDLSNGYIVTMVQHDPSPTTCVSCAMRITTCASSTPSRGCCSTKNHDARPWPAWRKRPDSTPSTELKCSCRGIGASPIRLLRG